MIHKFPTQVEIPLTEDTSGEMEALYNTANRLLWIRFAHEKRTERLIVSDIALRLYSCLATVRKYLTIPENEIPENKPTFRGRQHQLAQQ